MGEKHDTELRVDFNRSLKIVFRGAEVTSDAGLIAIRELDNAFGLTESAAGALADTRTGENIQHQFNELLRQSIYTRLAGYADNNDADSLKHDPTMRIVTGDRGMVKECASKSAIHRFETETLTTDENPARLRSIYGEWIQRAHKVGKPLTELILDMDGTDGQTFGAQEGGNYNTYYGHTCYRPLFLFNQFGDVEWDALREGQVDDATGWKEALDEVLRRYRSYRITIYFRGDAAFCKPELLDYLEAHGIKYVIRLPRNSVLDKKVRELLRGPCGGAARRHRIIYKSFKYKTKETWSKTRRVIAKVEWQPGELLPQVRFLVTNLPWSPKKIVKFYNKRGTAEQWIKEGKNATNWTRFSCHDFKDNEVRLHLSVMAYNLGNLYRRLVLPRKIRTWSLTSILENLIKTGAKLVYHSNYAWLQMAEVAIPRDLFATMLNTISRIRSVYSSG